MYQGLSSLYLSINGKTKEILRKKSREVKLYFKEVIL